MPTLMDALKNIRNQKVQPQQSQQQELQRVARARSGKAREGVGPKGSNLAEQAAIGLGQDQQRQQLAQAGMQAGAIQQQAEQTQQQQRQAGAAQRQDIQQSLANIGAQSQAQAIGRETTRDTARMQLTAQEQMQMQQMSNNYNNSLAKLQQETGFAREDLFRNFEQSNKELEDRQDAAHLEQLAHTMAMADQSYMDNLARVGKERGLADELAFQEEALEVDLGAAVTRALKQQGFNISMAMDDAEFARELAKINGDAALAVARSAAEASSRTQFIQGGTKALEAGVDLYGDYKKSQAAKKEQSSGT